MIKLGLLGNNISKSEMPNLITKLGNEFGFDLKYELFDQALKSLSDKFCKSSPQKTSF